VKADRWRTFQRKDGIASERVSCIAVDGDYVWFGTDKGLNRYDKTIDSWAVRTKTDGLISNDIRTIAVESDYIWVGMVKEEERDFRRFRIRSDMKPKTGGVSRYHRDTDSWNNYTKADGLIDNEISVIAIDENTVWFGTYQSGVSGYGKVDQIFVKTYTKTDLLVSDMITDVVADGNQIWFGTANGGVQRYIKPVKTWMNYTVKEGLSSNHITCITVSGNDVWFGTYEDGVSRFNKMSGEWTAYAKTELLADNDVRAIESDLLGTNSGEGNLWIATANGLSEYNLKANEWTNYDRKDGLATNYITTVKVTNECIWIGTDRGLGCRERRFETTSDLVSEQNGTNWKFYTNNDCFVNSIAVRGDVIWAGTSGGLYKFDRNKNQWESYVGRDSLPAEPVTAVALHDKFVMVGTENGLFKYSPESHTSVFVSDLGDNCINTILVSPDALWVGAYGGVARYDSSDESWLTLTDGLPNNNVRALASDGGTETAATLWIGTPQGLALLDTKELKITNFSDVVPYNIKSICVRGESLWLATTVGVCEISRNTARNDFARPTDSSLKKIENEKTRKRENETATPSSYSKNQKGLVFSPQIGKLKIYRSEVVLEPFLESSISNIESDGDYLWFSNWAASPNGCIVRYHKPTETWQRFTRQDILRNTKGQAMSQVRRIFVDEDAVWFSTDQGALRYDKISDTWKHYTSEDGLASNDLDILNASRNGVWIGSANGVSISQYDKKSGNWNNFDLPSEYPFESINNIETDGDNIWFGLDNALYKFNENTEQLMTYTTRDGLAANGAEWIAIDKDDIWIGQDGDQRRSPKALSRYDKTTGKWRIYSENDVLECNDVARIRVGEKYIWIIYPFYMDEAGISQYDKQKDSWTTIKPKGDWGGGVTDIAEDEEYLWLATIRSGIRRYHLASGTWTSYNETNALMHNHINERGLRVDGNYIWVGTPRGLSRFDKRNESWITFTNVKTLAGREVRAVATDSRYVWCGTSTGLSRYDKEYDTWTKFRKIGGVQEMRIGYSTWHWYEPESDDGLISNWVNCISIDDKYVWVGTREGANRYDKIANKWDRYTPKNGLPGEDITVVASDGGNVWMGTNAGIGKFPRTSDDENAWISYTSGIEIESGDISKEFAETLVSDEVWCIASDKKYVWVGTRLGISRYDKGKDIWKTFTKSDGLASDKVSCIAIQGSKVWFGTNSGVTLFDTKKDSWVTFTTEDGLTSNNITAISPTPYLSTGLKYGENGEDVWLGTYDAGVTKYDGQFRNFTKDDGLAHNGILSITADVDGENIWFGTQRGLSRYNKVTETWTTFTEHHGPEDI